MPRWRYASWKAASAFCIPSLDGSAQSGQAATVISPDSAWAAAGKESASAIANSAKPTIVRLAVTLLLPLARGVVCARASWVSPLAPVARSGRWSDASAAHSGYHPLSSTSPS